MRLLVILSAVVCLSACGNYLPVPLPLKGKGRTKYVGVETVEEPAIFLPPLCSIVRVAYEDLSTFEETEVVGKLTVIGDSFVFVDPAGSTRAVQIFFDQMTDFEIVSLPEDDSELPGDDTTDDEDDLLRKHCYHLFNKTHRRFLLRCFRHCKTFKIKHYLGKKKLKYIYECE